jgi:uncharacterized membrane protein
MHSNFNLSVIEIPFVLGVIFFVIGVIFYFFPPKKINYIYGYRTSTSMESQEKWDFSQKYSAIKMIQGSFFLFAVSGLGLLFSLTPNQQVIIGIAALIIHIIGMFYLTEKAIKKQFPNS